MTESILDLKALKANRNIAARTYWKNRMAGVVFKSYFGHYARGNEDVETFSGTAPAQSLLAMAPAAKAQYVVLLAALGVLTSKYSGMDDVVILTPSFSGEGIIPVRMQIGNSSFRELLLSLKEQLAQDMRYADYPLEKKLGDNVVITGMMLQGLAECDMPVDILFSFSVGETLKLEIKARNCNEHINLLPGAYFELLEQLLAKENIISYWNQAVKNNAYKTAVHPITFNQLNEDANKLSGYLRDKGVQAAQPVGILLERSPAYITAALAIVKTGAIIVPVDPSYDDETISTLIKGLACVISREDVLLKRDIKLFSAQICIDKHKPAIDKYASTDADTPFNETLFIQYSTRQGTEPIGNARSAADFMTELQWRWKNHPCPPGTKCGQRTNLRNSDHLFDIFGALLQGNTLVILNDDDPQDDIFCITDNIYVTAEAGIIAAGRSKQLVPIKEVSILDNGGHHLPAGVPGEIWVNGKRTGDIGLWLPDGSFELLGNREDDVMIGNYLTRFPVLEDAIVTTGENGEEKYLVVYHTSATQPQLTGLPAKYPVYYVKMEEFPRTSRGKIDRTLLPEPVTREEEKYVAPANEIEEKLADTWSDLLKLDKQDISVNASFFRLGGNSLRAITLVNKIHGLFGVDISVKEVFKKKSIRNLGMVIQASAKSEYSQFKKAEEREYYDLSISQQRLFYLHELDQSSLTLNIPSVLKIEGELDVARIRQAFQQMVQRQESLRTAFKTINERPVQLVVDACEFDVEYFKATEEEVDEIIQRFIRPFNIAQPPLFRVGVIQTAPAVFYLMVDIHHIITDGTSMGLMVKDFMAYYGGAQLPALELHYKDYATWQQSKGYKKRSSKQKQFWVNEFSEPIVPLDLPIDFIRPSNSSHDGEAIKFELDAEETTALRALAQAEVVTTSMVMLAVLNVLLGKMAHQEDVVIGMATAGREEFVLDNMIGMFPVVLPLRNHPKGNLKFSEFLSVLRTKFLTALDNQGYHYEELAKELKLERSTDRNPWFDVLFLYQNFEKPELLMPGMKVSLYKEKNIVAHEKLNITVHEEAEQIFFRLVYSKLLFRRESIERLVRYFKQVMQAVTADASIKIADIELARSEAISFNAEPLAEETFSDLFSRQVQQTPLRIAVEHNKKQLTYQELDAAARRLAGNLQQAGATPGKNIIIYMPRSIEMLTGIVATFYAGAAYVPIDTGFPAQRVLEILNDSETELILTTKELAGTINHKAKVICIEEIGDAIFTPVQRNVHDLAYIIYTSGTTGKPKGVMIHQLGMVNHLHAMVKVLGLQENDVIAQTASQSFDISVWQFLNALIVGAKTLIIDNEIILDPTAMLNCLQQEAVTIFQSVPSLMNTFLEDLLTEEDRALPALRWMIPTGEPLTAPLAKKWYACYPNIPLLNAYGPAEASDDVTTCVVFPPAEGQEAIPVGKPVQNMQVFILDNALKLCPIGVKGEICVAGVGVGKGYWKDEEKTKRSFIPNPYATGEMDAMLYKTGDVGYYLEDGNIVCLGRKDDQVKIRGLRIELGEIESRLLQHPSIREVAMLVKEWSGDQYLVAYYVADEELNAAELENYLAAHVPKYMVPSYFIHLTALPVTLNGKLDRRALPDPDIQSKEVYLPPTTETEKKLVDIWAQVLKTGDTPISIDTSFFFMGGHSLNAITVINKVYKEFNVKISLREFFLKPTIQGTAEFIEANRWLNEEIGTEEADRFELTV